MVKLPFVVGASQGQNPFWEDEKNVQERVISRCLELMCKLSGLRQDMCNFSEPGVLRSDIDGGILTRSLSPDLQYACRYWVIHLQQSQKDIVDGDATHRFLQKHLLHWLEAMSLMRESSRCVHLLNMLQTLSVIRSVRTLSLLHSTLIGDAVT